MSGSLLSLFSGAGGLDLGFRNAGFEIVAANEFDKTIYDTYRINHPKTRLIEGSITELGFKDFRGVDGVIGGPPCQAWSIAGARRGFEDPRGKLFYEYVRAISETMPNFFVAENVSGMMSHGTVTKDLKDLFIQRGYHVGLYAANAANYGVPQNRKRIFYIGFRTDLYPDTKNIEDFYKFPTPTTQNCPKTIRDAIGDIYNIGEHEAPKNQTSKIMVGGIQNHEYHQGSFSSIYLSRNRRKNWDEPAFTVIASAREARIHPSSCKMVKEKENLFRFEGDNYRRFTVRESARLQTFPDEFVFSYKNVNSGYKMIGNAVPVLLAQTIAKSIKTTLNQS